MPGELNYVRQGTGSPLLLLHGIGHRWQAWEPVIGKLARHHDVIAVDLPGFGRSPLPADRLSNGMESLLRELSAFADQLGLDRPHVAGNSLGGALGLELAAAGRSASATALSPAGFFGRGHRARALLILSALRANAFLPEPVLRAALRSQTVRRLSFGTLVVNPGRLTLVRMLGDAQALRRGRGFRPIAMASWAYTFTGTPKCPVTIAWSAGDRILPPSEAAIATARVPDAQHVTLPECGHVPMSDVPDLVAETILGTTGDAEPG
jgi:pimeloyl-ACP methyl ester carboxylesterase